MSPLIYHLSSFSSHHPATTYIYPLSLHDALPICYHERDVFTVLPTATLFSFTADQDFKDSTQYIPEADQGGIGLPDRDRSEEHTSELQSRFDLVCRLLLEKKKR